VRSRFQFPSRLHQDCLAFLGNHWLSRDRGMSLFVKTSPSAQESSAFRSCTPSPATFFNDPPTEAQCIGVEALVLQGIHTGDDFALCHVDHGD
jgi:hypothetical protein